jgi:hypothetical protein
MPAPITIRNAPVFAWLNGNRIIPISAMAANHAKLWGWLLLALGRSAPDHFFAFVGWLGCWYNDETPANTSQ